MPDIKGTAEKAWTTFRGWRWWWQALAAFFLLTIVVGPFIQDDEGSQADPDAEVVEANEPEATPASTTPTTAVTTPAASPSESPTTSNSTTTTSTSTTTTEVSLPDSFTGLNPSRIFARDFPDEWPFTVETGLLRCENDAIAFAPEDGNVYAINGTALAIAERRGWIDVDEIWLDSPTIDGLKVNIGTIIDFGLDLC